MKVVLTVFAPILVAIAIRIALFLIGFILVLPNQLFDIGYNWYRIGDKIGGFDTFNWDDSYGYWILVVIGSFLAEMAIWGDD